jgi:hypothetical protein
VPVWLVAHLGGILLIVLFDEALVKLVPLYLAESRSRKQKDRDKDADLHVPSGVLSGRIIRSRLCQRSLTCLLLRNPNKPKPISCQYYQNLKHEIPTPVCA